MSDQGAVISRSAQAGLGVAGIPVGGRRDVALRFFWIGVVAIVFFAAALRIPGLASRSLWLDEAYSAWFSALPLGELWHSVPQYETHPPLYYTLLKGWRWLFGASEAGLRSLSLAASVATVLSVSLSGRLLKLGREGEAVSLLAGLLLAMNAGNIKYAQEARPYALETLAVTIAIIAAARLVTMVYRQPGIGLRSAASAAVVLTLSGGLLLWCHNTALFVAFGIWCALGVAALMLPAADCRRLLAVAVISGFGALVLWSPFLPWFLKQSQAFGAMQFWIELSRFDLISAWILAGGGRTPAVLACLLAVPGLWFMWRRQPQLAVMLGIILCVPLSLVLIISFAFKPIYIDRLFGWMGPILMLLTACGIVGISRSVPVRGAVLAVLLLANLHAVTMQYAAPPIEDLRELSATIAADVRPGDAILAVPNELGVGFRYYSDVPGVTYLPGEFPYLAPAGERRYIGNLGAPAITQADVADLTARLGNPRRVWLVARRADLYDPNGLTAAAIGSGRSIVIERRFGPIELRLYGEMPN